MTENEVIKAIQNDLEWHSKELKPAYKEALRFAIQALEEIQQYRAIGLTPQMVKDLIASEKKAHKIALENADKLDEYQSIGTPDECRTAVERMKPKMKPLKAYYGEMKMHWCSCPNCAKGIDWEMGKHPNFCDECGIEFDWSE